MSNSVDTLLIAPPSAPLIERYSQCTTIMSAENYEFEVEEVTDLNPPLSQPHVITYLTQDFESTCSVSSPSTIKNLNMNDNTPSARRGRTHSEDVTHNDKHQSNKACSTCKNRSRSASLSRPRKDDYSDDNENGDNDDTFDVDVEMEESAFRSRSTLGERRFVASPTSQQSFSSHQSRGSRQFSPPPESETQPAVLRMGGFMDLSMLKKKKKKGIETMSKTTIGKEWAMATKVDILQPLH